MSIRIRNEAAKARNLAARKMDTLMKEVSGPLRGYIEGFPEPRHLHPFDAALLDLTISQDRYMAVLKKVDALRKSTLEVEGKALLCLYVSIQLCLVWQTIIKG